MSRTILVVILVACAVAAVIIAIRELGEAKDRWVTKLSGNHAVRAFVAWSRKGVVQLMTTLLAVGLTGALIGAAGFVGVYFAVRNQIASETEPGTEPNPALKPTALFVDYEMGVLPFEVPPKTTGYVLRISPKAFNGFYVIQGGGKPSHWPESADKEKPIGFTTLCKVTNHGDTKLLQIKLVYKAEYRQPDEKGQSKGTDPVVASRDHVVTVSALAAGDTLVFRMVNTTQMMASVTYPETSVVQVFGEDSPRKIKVMRSSNSVVDQMTFPLFPTKHQWLGFPE